MLVTGLYGFLAVIWAFGIGGMVNSYDENHVKSVRKVGGKK